MRLALATTLASLFAVTAAFAQNPPADPPQSAADAPAADPPTAEAPPADAQSDARAAAAERCRAARSTESRLRSSRRQRCAAAVPQTDAASPQLNVQTTDDDPAQSPMQPPVGQQPH